MSVINLTMTFWKLLARLWSGSNVYASEPSLCQRKQFLLRISVNIIGFICGVLIRQAGRTGSEWEISKDYKLGKTWKDPSSCNHKRQEERGMRKICCLGILNIEVYAAFANPIETSFSAKSTPSTTRRHVTKGTIAGSSPSFHSPVGIRSIFLPWAATDKS